MKIAVEFLHVGSALLESGSLLKFNVRLVSVRRSIQTRMEFKPNEILRIE